MHLLILLTWLVGVNAHCYDFTPVHDTPAPKGYKAFYISHYGRHGARADMGYKYYPLIIDSLTALSQQQALTPKQDSLLHLTQRINAAYGNMNRRLTPVGMRQQQMLATRMAQRFPEVFRGKPQVRAISSMVPRCIMSMNAFTNALTAQCPNVQYTFDCGEKYQQYINCRGLLKLTWEDTPRVVDSLLQAYKYTPSAWKEAVYQTCIYAQCFDIPCNIFDFLTEEDVRYYDAKNTYQFYLNFCNNPYGRLRRPYAQLGLNDIIDKADSAITNHHSPITNQPIVADLRFGHDDPLLAMVSLMELEGVGDALPYGDILSKWQGAYYVPMAANVQLVFYKGEKARRLNGLNGDVLVKVLYNEQECHIHGLKPVESCYYHWADVRAKWLNTHRLATYNVRYINRDSKKADKGDRSWAARREYVLKNVLENQMDIVGMNEVTGNNRDSITGKSQLQDLQEGLKDYTCIAYEREDKDYSYNCIFYRTAKYDCLRHYSFWLSQTPEVASKEEGSKYYRRCIVALMKDKTTGQQFYFCCAHTDFDPLIVGEKHAQLLGERLAPLAKGYTPLVLVGDLNYDRYDKPSIHRIYARYFLDSSNDHATPTYNRWRTLGNKDGKCLEIDYLYYLNMLPRYRKVVTEDYGRGVPPSDHFPVYVDFQLQADPTYDPIQ